MKDKKFKFIAKFGVELEGFWSDSDYDLAIRSGKCTFGRDGSVGGGRYRAFEVLPVRPFESVEQFNTFMEVAYPTQVNSTCGYHIHVSFKSALSYQLLMDKKFWEYFLRKIEQWGKKNEIRNENFWNRLNDKNTYCKRKFCPLGQRDAFGKDGERYTFLNYCWNYRGTVECRLLPMFKDVKWAKRSAMAVLSIMESYLQRHAENKKHEAEVQDDAGQEALVPVKVEDSVVEGNGLVVINE